MSVDRETPSLGHDDLREIVEGTAAETGEQFFDELSKHLARALGTKCAWITEWLPEQRRLKALSFWLKDDYVADYEYAIEGTPCEPVIEKRSLIHIPDRIIELFPRDPDLYPISAVSYIGVPLLDTDGEILGHLAVMHNEPMPEDPRATSIFNIFASRAAAELRRLRRDRDLKERELKLSRLIASAMDAIIELDSDSLITGVNSAAEEVFGCKAAGMIGLGFDFFLTAESRGKLAYLTHGLESQPEGKQSLWIPDGIEARHQSGEIFPAEATLSRFEVDGRPFYTMILRNINERLEAEERIRALMQETESLQAEIDALHGFEEIIGESDALRRVLADVEKVAPAETSVLITGETGTGKELLARAIHERSPRSGGPLIKVNCAAIPANLQESEFFGHEKGAFTGATQRREGRFKLADGGTIFLDEVGELPLDLQSKLLRVLQEGEFEAVGGTRTEQVNVRVIAATNRDLGQMVKNGGFREDLLYRLNVFPLHAPPLRERGDDVVMLAEVFAAKLAQKSRKTPVPLTPADRARLKRYDWPGNVRELQNVIERAFITSMDGRRLNLERALPDPMLHSEAVPRGTPEDRILTAVEMQDVERQNILRALGAAGGKISGAGGAAEKLGLNPNTLSSRMKSLQIEKPRKT
jgi:PAS domain S-box-containing protein